MDLEYLNSKMIHLHTHCDKGSNLRLLDSTNKVKDMVKYVDSLGQYGFALTDHESLSGHVEFLRTVEDYKQKNEIKNNFKAILGNEIYLTDKDMMYREIREDGATSFYHFLLIAKDRQGYDMLKKLTTMAWESSFSYKGMERVPTFYSDIEEIIGDNKGHLIGSTACLGGYFAKNVSKMINEDTDEEESVECKYRIHDFIQWCLSIFGKEDFYIEIQPSQMIEQIEFNKMAIKIAKAYGIKVIVTTDAHYLRPEDRSVHEAFLTSDEEGESNREVGAFYSSTHFFTSQMLFENLRYLDEQVIEDSIMNTYEVYSKIEEFSLKHKQVIPRVAIPNEEEWFKDKEIYEQALQYGNIKKLIESNEINNNRLVNMSLEGMKKKIKLNKYKESFERMDVECGEIIGISEAKGEPVSAYFVTMAKNIDIIWEEAEGLVMPSRGSAAGYLINYLVGITQINPLEQGILMPHWRFISAERPDYPDIDIDYPSYKKIKVFECLKKYYQSIGGDIVRVATFGTKTSKSAILTACRGLKINGDVGLYLSSLIPVERGKVWSIEDCYYGNEKEGRQPITEFKNMVDEHERLLEVSLGVQGLIDKRSSHPCGILIVNEDFTKFNAKMKAPSGETISQFDLNESEYLGNIKYDFLNTKTCSMIQKCLEMLIEHNKVEWQGDLRKTYDKYLRPEVLEMDSEDMWKKLNNGQLISAFQFDSMAGEQALKAIKPMNLLEGASANTLMRLMAEEGEERPLELYVRYKNDLNEWYKDMESFGLTNKEIEILNKYLKNDYGVCATQESMMLMSMDKDISSFNVKEANMLRKSVAKKKKNLLKESEDLLYSKGEKLGNSKKLLDYVWQKQFSMQKGYSFSVLHTIGYTYVLIQQLNLIHKYPPIYWNTAVLLVESGALDSDEDKSGDIKSKEKTTQYGTVAKAIGNMQDKGVKISLPDANLSDLGFLPNEDENSIRFGLKGIMKINNETAQQVIKNRPYKSVQNFHDKLVAVKREVSTSTGKIQKKSIVSEAQLIMLIKAGSFDDIEDKPREQILEDYLRFLNPIKKKLDSRNISTIIEMGMIPTQYSEQIRFFKFREYLKTLKNKKDENSKSIKWYCIKCRDKGLTDYSTQFFIDNFSYDMQEEDGYAYDEEGYIWVALGTKRKDSFEYVYTSKVQGLMDWMNSKECIEAYNNSTFNEIKNEAMFGGISHWEMESMNFYYTEHELKGVNEEKYYISNFNKLSEEPKVVGFTKYKGMKYPKFDLTRIVGTVLDKDKTRHTVTLLTCYGVVTLKFYSGQFSFYDKQISIYDKEADKKTTLENGWFKRGTKLLVTGFRRGDQFKPKKYSNSIFQHTLAKIESMDSQGNLALKFDRERGE